MKTTFQVLVEIQSKQINRLMQAAAFADAVAIPQAFNCTITWKDGETITQERIDKLKPVVKKMWESKGYIVTDIRET